MKLSKEERGQLVTALADALSGYDNDRERLRLIGLPVAARVAAEEVLANRAEAARLLLDRLHKEEE